MNAAEAHDSEAPSNPPAAPMVAKEVRPGDDPFPIVGIGASAGGLEAVSQLLSALPDKTGMGFVLVIWRWETWVGSPAGRHMTWL